MTRLLVVAIIMASSCIQALGQAGFTKTNEKEISYKGSGQVILEAGETISGLITHSRITQRRVTIEREDGTQQTYKISEVKGFTINGDVFEKILPPTIAVKDPEFATVLSNPASPIKIYLVCYQENISLGSNAELGLWPTHREYYALFPSIGKLKDLSNIAFTPFAKKVSTLVQDCPAVSARIKNKEKGYTIGLLSTDQDKINVFVNIANAYHDECK